MAIILSAFGTSASAQQKALKNTPFSDTELAEGSQDLDVAYVPTPMIVVEEILKLGSVGPTDFLIDLGSGDGRIVITAARKYGARGLGVDLNSKLVELSRKYALEAGVAKQAKFSVQDIFVTDIDKADVIAMYLLPEVNIKLRSKLLKELKPGTRIVSHDYHLGEWRPDKTVLMNAVKREEDDSILYLWIVPAKAAGTWYWTLDIRGEDLGFILKLHQNYQDISGTAWNKGHKWPVFNPSLAGNRIYFSLISEAEGRIIRQDYAGIIQGKKIAGSVKISGATMEKQLKWNAFYTKEGAGSPRQKK